MKLIGLNHKIETRLNSSTKVLTYDPIEAHYHGVDWVPQEPLFVRFWNWLVREQKSAIGILLYANLRYELIIEVVENIVDVLNG